ncbi:hypothetical protein [Butyrivibrio sp. VCB2006]|uniref:hypothetical protein n=1 Tax=Butyrivibrio sp. VCB2006 TaxID=1280679 RepID=UPI00049250A3|nr:hypothetical protein [Butyrivibrio sp. VCB2006]
MKLGKILDADESYRENLNSFSMKDSLIALIYYIAILIADYVMGVFQSRTGIYPGDFVCIVCMGIPVVLCIRRLSKIGISNKNLIRSILVSLCLGIIVLMGICIIPNIMAHSQMLPAKRYDTEIQKYNSIVLLNNLRY